MIRYVKFIRGTPQAFNALSKKDEDTLYVIYDNDESNASLYLGSRLIVGDGVDLNKVSIDELQDVLISNEIENESLLIYDSGIKQWVNKSLADAIMTFVGATTSSKGVAGLVPPPPKGQRNLFLRSDGSWAVATSGTVSNLSINSKTFEYGDNGDLNLLGFENAPTGTTAVKSQDGSLEWVDYKSQLDKKVDWQKDARLITNEEANKLNKLLNIQKVGGALQLLENGTLILKHSNEFEYDESGLLSIKTISHSKIVGLDQLLQQNNQAVEEINSLKNQLIWKKL